MRLSEEKVERLAELLVERLEERSDLVEILGNPGGLEREIGRLIVQDLKIEDEINQEALEKMKTYSRMVEEGTTEWTLLLAKHKDEIAARRGYVVS